MCVVVLISLSVNCIAMVDALKPAHVGLEHEAQLARGWKSSVNGRNGKKGRDETSHEPEPPIKYIHLHECDKFSVRILIFFSLYFAAWHCLLFVSLFG